MVIVYMSVCFYPTPIIFMHTAWNLIWVCIYHPASLFTSGNLASAIIPKIQFGIIAHTKLPQVKWYSVEHRMGTMADVTLCNASC